MQSPSNSGLQSPSNQLYNIDSISDPSDQKDERKKSVGKKGSSTDPNRVLFFKKDTQFAYQSIPISPNYHMVVEEDHGLYPKLAILPSNVPSPEPPKGSWMLSPKTTKGPIGIYRTPLERNSVVIKESEEALQKPSLKRKAYHHRYGSLALSGFGDVTQKSTWSDDSYDMFSKIDSKFGRVKETV